MRSKLFLITVICAVTPFDFAKADPCDELVTNELLDMSKLVACLQKEAVPSGAVMAFDLPHGCPKGWEADISAAEGRMIIGVNGSSYKLPYVDGRPEYSIGGSESHKLTIEEMPSHTHELAKDKSGSDFYVLRFVGGNNDSKENGAVTTGGGLPFYGTTSIPEAGSDRPHNNMPPYIALRYCKKE